MCAEPSPASKRWSAMVGPAVRRRPKRALGTTRSNVAIELNPLEQFTIERLVPLHIGKLDVSFTNSALMMVVVVVLVTALVVLSTRKAALVPGRWQSVSELLYEFVADMIDTNAGHGGRQAFSFIFPLFTFFS